MKQVVRILKALANERRLLILRIVQFEECSVIDIADKLRISVPAATRHLQVLDRARCLKRSKEGQYVLSSLLNPMNRITKLVLKIII